ncbi:MAG: DUF5702 domain-containing protein [Clostridia bacterium]|nr:DUF5702 domain-containing protein [Clostridia bacterium]
MKSKKGSYTVFITLVLCTVLVFLSVVIKVSTDVAVASSVDTIGNLTKQSILSEYDLILKKRYGIFAVRLNDYTLSEKVKYYYDYTFSDKHYVDISEVSGHPLKTLVDGNCFVSQVKDTLLYFGRPELPEYLDIEDEEEILKNHRVNARWILSQLPSHGDCIGIDGNLISNVSINEYLFIYFKDYVNDRELGKTYFRNEIEYILTGTPDDEKARKEVKTKLILERNVNNIAYLYSCEEKRQEALMFAELIAPEFGPAVQALILEAWAFLESVNDVELLYEKKKVPLLKDDSSWAITFENAMENILGSDDSEEKTSMEIVEDFDYEKEYDTGAIEPDEIKGLTYDDYLKTLLLLMNEEKKVYRTLDLIQLNMKYIYDETFLIKEYATAFSYDITVNGRKYSFEASY